MNNNFKYKASGKYNETSILYFAKWVLYLLKSNRDVSIAVGGMTGEGKSTFSIQLVKAYCKLLGIKFSFEMLTWSRKELLNWIDGLPKSEKDEQTGLKPLQKPEFSPIIADELFKMFYKRTWFDKEQIEVVSTLNMCRDRHLFIIGNVPDFWSLDKAFQIRMRFYAYVKYRDAEFSYTDVYIQDNTAFNKDTWNYEINKTIIETNGDVYKSRNYLFTIVCPDLSEDEKKEYQAIRDDKRVKALQEDIEDAENIDFEELRKQTIKEYQKKLFKSEVIAELEGKKLEPINKSVFEKFKEDFKTPLPELNIKIAVQKLKNGKI